MQGSWPSSLRVAEEVAWSEADASPAARLATRREGAARAALWGARTEAERAKCAEDGKLGVWPGSARPGAEGGT